MHSKMYEELALFPGLPTIQFLTACSGGGRPGPFYHVNDVLVDRGEEGSPIEKTSFRPYLVVSAPSAGVSSVHKVKNLPLLFQTKNACAICVLSIGDPSPLLST